MLAGCLWSRALLSVSTILFIAFACLHRGILVQLKNAFSNGFTVSIMLLFFIPFVTGLWSNDFSAWKGLMQNKLPFLFLPIAFCREWNIKDHQWKFFIQMALLLLVAATLVSTGQYLLSKEMIDQSYLKSKLIPVPVFGDHIRFSWLICAGFISLIYMTEKSGTPKHRVIYFIVALWFIIYLHLLGARTGLAGCYIFILIYCIHLFIKKGRTDKYYIGILIIGIIIVSAWLLFPTLRNRIRYMKYNLSFIMKDEYLPHSNDGNRMLSLKAGWAILEKNPFGAGAGDVKGLVSKWYDNYVQKIPEDEKIFPSNEWLIHGDYAGWPGIIVFTIAFFAPLFQRVKRGRVFIAGLHLTAFVACFFDSSLELQPGIYIYCFTTLLWWKIFLPGRNDTESLLVKKL